jgi:nucleoside-diphosphate-sugar epimerase
MILITGASGHLGANLARRLVSEGAELRLLARPSSDRAAFDGLAADIVLGDLTDLDSCRRAVAGVTDIYHCAAQISTHYGAEQAIFANNVLGTRNLLRAAREAGSRRVVVSGSFSATGHRVDRPTDESEPFNPLERHLPYAFTKAAVEHECLKACVEGLEVVIAVSCAILGPYDFKPSRMGRVLQRFARRRILAYVPGGFEFVATRDIVEGHVLCMQRGRPGQKYIFSTRFATFDELMHLFARVTGRPLPPLRLSPSLMSAVARLAEPVMRIFLPRTPQLLTPAAIRLLRQHRRVDCAKAAAELGYCPTDIESAVQEAYDWFLATGRVAAPGGAVARPALQRE